MSYWGTSIRTICYVCNNEFEKAPNSKRILCKKCNDKRDLLIRNNRKIYPIITNCIRCNKQFEALKATQVYCNQCSLNIINILNNKSKITKDREEKIYLYNRNSARCYYCDSEIDFSKSEIDHIIAKSKNGSDDILNKELSCRQCNRLKSDKSIKEFILILKKYQFNTLNKLIYYTKILNKLEMKTKS